MESLAYLVVIILMTFILAGPLALLLTLLKPKNKALKITKRILQGIILALMFLASIEFILELNRPLGVYGLLMIYLALSREYFPNKKFLVTLLKNLTKK